MMYVCTRGKIGTRFQQKIENEDINAHSQRYLSRFKSGMAGYDLSESEKISHMTSNVLLSLQYGISIQMMIMVFNIPKEV